MAPVNGSNAVGNMFALESRKVVEISLPENLSDAFGDQIISFCRFPRERYDKPSVRQHQTDSQQCGDYSVNRGKTESLPLESFLLFD